MGIVEPMPVELDHMLDAAVPRPADWLSFAKTLMANVVYVLVSPDMPTVEGAAQSGTEVRLVKFSDEDGFFVPFFTSEATMLACLAARAGTRPNCVRLQCRVLFEMTKGSRLVLDPCSSCTRSYVPSEIESLLAGREPGLGVEDGTEPTPSPESSFCLRQGQPDQPRRRRGFLERRRR
jgi:hypothetical protein